jgi:hypothetical protein
MRDCANKGRNIMQLRPDLNHFRVNKYPPRGEAQGSSKLTKELVEEIREMKAKGLSSAVIAQAFGLSSGHVRKICIGSAWAHTQLATFQRKQEDV